jgi:very-short-patch-repair endonuclease
MNYKRYRKENNRLDQIAKQTKNNFIPTVVTRAKEEVRIILLNAPAKRIPIGKHTLKKKKRKYKSNSKAIQAEATKSRIQRYADKLNHDLPISERWFQRNWNAEGIEGSKYNEVLGHRIPDVINHIYHFIIEVDGSIHNTEYQKKIDKMKDNYFRKKGFTVFRVIAYNEDSYKNCLNAVKELIKLYDLARISPVLEQGGPDVNKV